LRAHNVDRIPDPAAAPPRAIQVRGQRLQPNFVAETPATPVNVYKSVKKRKPSGELSLGDAGRSIALAVILLVRLATELPQSLFADAV
jgi:hypothetical protein